MVQTSHLLLELELVEIPITDVKFVPCSLFTSDLTAVQPHNSATRKTQKGDQFVSPMSDFSEFGNPHSWYHGTNDRVQFVMKTVVEILKNTC